MINSKIDIYFDYLFGLCISVLITGIYLYGLHGAIQNVTFAVIGGGILLKRIINRDLSGHFPVSIIISFLAIYLFYVFVLWLDFTDSYTFSHGLSNRVLILLFPLMFALVPFQKAGFYHFYFWVYILSSIVHSLSTLKTYYHDVLVDKFYLWSGGIHPDLISLSIHHHHAGILAVFSIGLLIVLIRKYFVKKQYILLFIGVVFLLFLTFFIHILAARISLLAFYLLIFTLMVYGSLKNRYLFYSMFLVMGAVIVFFLFFGIGRFSTIQIKVDQTIMDVRSIREEGLSNKYNISGRLNAIKFAIPMIEKNYWQGVGINKYEKTFEEFYQTNYPEYPATFRLTPANQWVRYLVSVGIPLTFIFGVLMLVPYLLRKNYLKKLIAFFFLLNTLYFMSEFPLDNNNYFYFYSFTLPFLIHYYFSFKVKPKEQI